MSTIRDLIDSYVAEQSRLDPIGASERGILGHDEELTDYSPDGAAARRALAGSTLSALRAEQPRDEADRIARDLLLERLAVLTDSHDAGEWMRELRNLASPAQAIRECFDLMATGSREDWETIGARMSQVPAAFVSVVATYRQGLQQGVLAARRQVETVIEQARTWAGGGGGADDLGYFSSLAAQYGGHANADGALAARLVDSAQAADAAVWSLCQFLRDEYLPKAPAGDAVGRERYELGVRESLGTELDLEATYAWGWEELARIEAEMVVVAREIDPDRSLDEVVTLLDTDPARAIEGAEPFRQWLQATMDEAIAALHPRHFDIAPQLQRVEAMIAPPGGAAAMYYTAPTDDFSRPGRTWYPPRGLTRFPLWQEVSTAYHEGVPGHHLQVGQLKVLGDQLTAYQRTDFVSGHGEGWALYAERLMSELGLFAKPEYVLGMLAAQAFRATRVIVDLGMHLQLAIPADQPYHPGERWTPELALPFAIAHSRNDAEFMTSEITRYLGWPAQAISYKVGEREWLEIRAEARAAAGAGFDLKSWHMRALALGPLGLAQLRREVSGVASGADRIS